MEIKEFIKIHKMELIQDVRFGLDNYTPGMEITEDLLEEIIKVDEEWSEIFKNSQKEG